MEFTSLQGHVTATFQELVEAFGAPTYSEPSGDGKVNTEWELILGTDAVRAPPSMTGKISTVVVDLVMANHMIGTLVVKVQWQLQQ